MKKTKIVCTIGPTCQDEDTLARMIVSGMNVARFNMSHGTIESQTESIQTLYRVRDKLGKPCAAMVDITGPSVRIGAFVNKRVTLVPDQKFVFTTRKVEGDEHHVEILYKDIVKAAHRGDSIYVDNGLIEFKVTKVTDTDIICRVVNGGSISTNKSVCLPGLELKMEYLSSKDKAALDMAARLGVEMVSISFVTNVDNVRQVRNYLKRRGGNQLIVSKIENREGINNLDGIIEASDGIMVARGDLGTEIPIEEIPSVQKDMIKRAVSQGKIIITATEMLESMIEKIRPTRAETTDVANAVYDGTGATMLSGETANGKYPVAVVQTMSRIVEATERVIDYDSALKSSYDIAKDQVTAIAYSTCLTSKELGAKAIVCFTKSGKTAVRLSMFRPEATIVAVTASKEVFNKLSTYWGIVPILLDKVMTTNEMLENAGQLVKQSGIAKKNDTIIITSGMPAEDETNFIKTSRV